jgi:hypothetical protein
MKIRPTVFTFTGEEKKLKIADIAVDTSEYFILKDVSAFMFQCPVEGKSPEEIYKAVLDKYDIDETTVKKDFAALVEELNRNNLLE